MDPDVFPNSLEYWGPNGMVFFRNIQARWMPLKGDTGATIALERPGASADLGDFADEPALMEVIGRFPVPDLTAEFHYGGKWGYVRLAGILRRINWDHVGPTGPDLSGDATGWGLNLSSNIKVVKPVVFRLQFVGGRGIQNYMNDAGDDIGVETTGNAARPLEGETIPVLGGVAFADIAWSEHFASSAGYSFVWVRNTNGQLANAFHVGHYALANFLWTPVKEMMVGIEAQYGHRFNNSDGFDAGDFRLQFTAKFSFDAKIEHKVD
jgi:hypothetical protein